MKRRISILCLASFWAATTVVAATMVPLDMSSGRPVVEIEVNGSAPLKMVLDTGAGGSVIDAEVAQNLGLEVIGEQQIGDPSGRNQHTAKTVILPGVRIGGAALGDLEVGLLDLQKTLGHGHRSFDGVLSVRDLDRNLVTLDLAEGELRFTKGELDLTEDNVVPYLTGKIGVPSVQVLVGPLTVQAVLDIGNPGQLSLARGVAKHLELDGPLEVVGKRKTASSTFEISAATLDGTVNLAGHTIENPTLFFDRLHHGTQSNIGSGLLSQFVVTIDQRKNLVRFEKGNPGSSHQMASAPPDSLNQSMPPIKIKEL